MAFALAAHAADEAVLALALRAQTDFHKVEAAAVPATPDLMRCVQTQAAVLPVARPPEAPLIHFRKGYCELLNGENRAAAHDFARALAEWDYRSPEPVSAGLLALSSIARLRSGSASAEELSGIRAGLERADTGAVCLSNLMTPSRCRELVDTGRLWAGWLALERGELNTAGRYFAAFSQSAWRWWTAGLQALQEKRYSQAAGLLRKAVETWRNDERHPQAGMAALLGPKPDLPAAVFQLAGAGYLAGEYEAAAADAGAAIKADPGNAGALFLRGRAREALGQAEAALADYQLASRLAFAHPDRPQANAQAHYYRGVWLFLRKSYSQAEDEFVAALNNGAGPLVPDLTAWRYTAAVAGGACQASAANLEQALPAASPLAPKDEARRLLQACQARL
ncbi:MAG: hypothetical protein ACE15B_16470 [Bryobacteraceae bacterium]